MAKKIIPFLVGFSIFFGLFYLLSHPQKSNSNQNTQNQEPTVTIGAEDTSSNKGNFPNYDDPDLIFYFGDGCPHCENVEDWISQNDLEGKLKINRKEVYYDQQNQTELYDTVKQFCPDLISSSGGIGVPTAFDPINKNCIQGDTPIIEFLSSKMSE